MELVEKLRACFFKVVFVKETPEAATHQAKNPYLEAGPFVS